MTERIRVDAIVTGTNYRQTFEGIDELAANIHALGLLQPLVVNQLDDGRYLLVAGERRLRAVRVLGWEHVDATVRTMTERQHMLAATVENEQRHDPNPIDQAENYRNLTDEYGIPVDEIAESIGRKPGYVRDRLALLDLASSLQAAVQSGAMPYTVALAIRDLDHNRQVIAMRDYLANPGWPAERWKARVDELRSEQGLEAQGSITDGFLQNAEYVIPDVDPRRKIGKVGLARLLEAVLEYHDEAEPLPDPLVHLIRKAVDDNLSEKAQARRAAAQRAWGTMRKERAG